MGQHYPRLASISWVKAVRAPHFPTPPPRTAAQKEGKRYERRVHAWALDRYGPLDYIPSPWFQYGDGSLVRFAQPDGLLLGERRAIIVEIKL